MSNNFLFFSEKEKSRLVQQHDQEMAEVEEYVKTSCPHELQVMMGSLSLAKDGKFDFLTRLSQGEMKRVAWLASMAIKEAIFRSGFFEENE